MKSSFSSESSVSKRCRFRRESPAPGVYNEEQVANLMDRLSELPHDVIVSILSRLKLKEAARTSVLSRKWRYLWTYTTTLDFYYSDSHEPEYNDIFYFFRIQKRVLRNGKLRIVERSQLVSWMDHVLSSHQGLTIDEFELSLFLCGRIRKEFVNRWVEFALRKRVKRLKLDFLGSVSGSRGNYGITKRLLRSFNSNLDSLTVLSLNKVDVTSKALHYVLSKCPFLEVFHMQRSYTLSELKIPGSLSQLKCLKIKDCACLELIEVHAINIVSFSLHGRETTVTFAKDIRLVEASFGDWFASYFIKNIAQFSSYISRIESLDLELVGPYIDESGEMLPEVPVFENLRNLKLIVTEFERETTLSCCVLFLARCPVLGRLSLVVSPEDRGDETMMTKSMNCLHNNLKVLELATFGLVSRDVLEICCSLVSGLPSLEQVILHPRIERISLSYVDVGAKLAKCSERLKKIMPPRAELIIHDLFLI